MEVSTFFKFTHWSPVWFWMPVWSWRRQPLYNLYILKKMAMRWWHAYWPCMWQHELICTLGASLRSVLYGLARTSCRQCHRMTLCLFRKKFCNHLCKPSSTALSTNFGFLFMEIAHLFFARFVQIEALHTFTAKFKQQKLYTFICSK